MKDFYWIAATLINAYFPAYIHVVDESHKHKHHAHGGKCHTHFAIHIVADAFVSMSRLERHRAIYACLEPAFKEGLHALSIHAKTKEDFQ